MRWSASEKPGGAEQRVALLRRHIFQLLAVGNDAAREAVVGIALAQFDVVSVGEGFFRAYQN